MGMVYKSLAEIVADGREYMLRVMLASLAVGVVWHGYRGGIPDMLGLRLVSAAFLVCSVVVVVFGGSQGGVAGLIMAGFAGISKDRLAALIRDEIRQSEAQRFHPLHAVLGSVPVGLLGVVIMLNF